MAISSTLGLSSLRILTPPTAISREDLTIDVSVVWIGPPGELLSVPLRCPHCHLPLYLRLIMILAFLNPHCSKHYKAYFAYEKHLPSDSCFLFRLSDEEQSHPSRPLSRLLQLLPASATLEVQNYLNVLVFAKTGFLPRSLSSFSILFYLSGLPSTSLTHPS